MNDINMIRIELCKMNCRVHMKLPTITRNSDALEFHTCCDDFKNKLTEKFKELLEAPPVKLAARRRIQ